MKPQAFTAIPEYIGPYENWSYDVGNSYAFPDIRKFQVGDPLTTLIEMEDPVLLAGLGAQIGKTKDGKEFTFILPSLWWGNGDFATRFLPFGIPMDENAATGMGLSSAFMSGWAPDRLFASSSQKSGGDDAFVSRFRANFPLPKDVIHLNYDNSSTKDGSWKKDPETVEVVKQNKRLTIVGVIDDGIPFAHRNFRKLNGQQTRIEYCWLQSASATASSSVPRTHAQVLFGQEFTRNQIDDLIAQYPDEDRLYEAAGVRDVNPELGVPLERAVTHGSHIMDLAVGVPFGRGEAPPDDIRIIAVQLPNTVGWDTSGFGKDMYMLSALHYIFERADRIAGEYYGIKKADDNGPAARKRSKSIPTVPVQFLPLVVNMSVGFSGGPHDADKNDLETDTRNGSEIEHAIDEMVAHRREFCAPTAVVLPAGNNFSDRMHAVLEPFRFEQDDGAYLDWRIQPNDRTPSFLELWLPKEANIEDYRIVLSSPTGADLEFDPTQEKRLAGDPAAFAGVEIDGQLIGQLSVDKFRQNRWRILIAMGATEPEASLDPVNGVKRLPPAVPAGRWRVTISLKSGGQPCDSILCWIQRDIDVQLKNTGARQSYFDMPAYQRFGEDGTWQDKDADGAAVRRFGSLNGMSTGLTPLIVAGFRGSAQSGYRTDVGTAPFFSAAGPEKPEVDYGRSVDLAALTSTGVAIPGLVAAGTKSGSLGLVLGTSVAAPQVTRALARKFADGLADTYSEKDNYLGLLPGVEVGEPETGKPDRYTPSDLHEPEKRLGDKFLPPIRHFQRT